MNAACLSGVLARRCALGWSGSELPTVSMIAVLCLFVSVKDLLSAYLREFCVFEKFWKAIMQCLLRDQALAVCCFGRSGLRWRCAEAARLFAFCLADVISARIKKLVGVVLCVVALAQNNAWGVVRAQNTNQIRPKRTPVSQ